MNRLQRLHIRSDERGLVFRDREFREILEPGTHWHFNSLGRSRIDVVSTRTPWLFHEELDAIIDSGALGENATVLELRDHERALVWVDGRFDRIFGRGRHAAWTTHRTVRYEIVDIREPRFDHAERHAILQTANHVAFLNRHFVPEGFAGVLYIDGKFQDILAPGEYLFWKRPDNIRVYPVDLRETVLDVSGQELMTADKVSLRMNAMVAFRVADARASVESVDDSRQALYREAQLALRSVVGALELDAFLTDRQKVEAELEATLRRRAAAFGMEVVGLGIRDVILPGDMKALLNQVMEARKMADANLITRREETAAMRSQANTAKILENNPTLMRLRELDVLEKVAAHGTLKVVLGEGGLSDKIVNLL